jgi:tetratricopeptide (TPR) repeat protein
MLRTLSLLCLLANLHGYGQPPDTDALRKMLESRDFDQVIEKILPVLNTSTDKVELNLLLGQAYAEKDEFKTAIPYLEYAAKNGEQNSKAWALAYLGSCYFMTGEQARSKSSFDECLKPAVSAEITRHVNTIMAMLGFHDGYSSWKVVESGHFRFHFQDMPDADIQRFVVSRELAFEKINSFFRSSLPKKIDFFIWKSREDAKKMLNRNLGFANPTHCVAHLHYQQTVGHEMTHVISDFSVDIRNKSGLINEGVAVCFDQTSRSKEEMAKKWLIANEAKVDIVAMWTNWKLFPEELSYPVAGLLIRELIDTYGRDKFLEFFKIQTYENAQQVFGKDLDDTINRIHDKLNNR